MRYRAFDDYVGRRWEVWQTNPPRSDRRSTERRSDSDRRREMRASAPERRSDDRRSSDDRRNQSLRFPGIPQLEAGWLCFESDGVRKRLAPVPEAWENVDDMTLAALCNFASEEIRGW